MLFGAFFSHESSVFIYAIFLFYESNCYKDMLATQLGRFSQQMELCDLMLPDVERECITLHQTPFKVLEKDVFSGVGELIKTNI